MRFRRLYLIALASGVLVFIAIGFLSIGAFFFLRARQRTVTVRLNWSNPIAEIKVEKVWPGVALLPLTDVDDLTAINQALAEDELESACALIVFSTELSDQERAGSLLLLGQRYNARGDRAKAKLCYRLVNTIATLSPALSDFDRANAYLQSGQGLYNLKDGDEAKFNYDLARTVALYSPYLKKTHRQRILDRLIEAYRALGEDRAEWEDLENHIMLESDEPLALNPEEELLLGDLFKQEVVLPEIQEAAAERQRIAQALLDHFRERGGEAPERLIYDLAVALQVEDAVRLGTYEANLVTSSQLSDKIALAWAEVNWLTLKYVVALKGYGLSLVPEWEDQLGKIQSELSKAYEQLYALYGEQIIALPEASSIDRAWVEVLRQEIQVGRLGLYPNYPEERLIEKLREATEQLTSLGYDCSLRVDVIAGQDTKTFILTSDECYGQR